MMGGSKQKERRSGCYHCGSDDHKAKHCPNATCRKCGQSGHNVAACPQEKPPPVDMGSFSTPTPHSRFRYIELFAGIGGFRLALDQLGGACVFASEIDRFARTNYELNHGDRPAGDITRINAQEIPDHDMLVGGFPCQSFSSSGKRLGLEDTRGVLFLEIVRIVKWKHPKVLLLENVRGLLTHEDGQTLQIICSTLEEAGYNMQYQLINAINLVPQERNRLYLVGIRNDLTGSNDKFPFPVAPPLGRGFCDIEECDLKEDVAKTLTLSEHQLAKVQQQKYTQQFPDARFLKDTQQPTKTLQSSYASYMVSSQFVPGPRSESWRKLTPREAARLQGFPETFKLCPARPYHQLGNAVVPGVIALVAAPLLTYLDTTLTGTQAQEAGWKAAKTLLLEACPQDERSEKLKAALEDGKIHFQVSS